MALGAFHFNTRWVRPESGEAFWVIVAHEEPDFVAATIPGERKHVLSGSCSEHSPQNIWERVLDLNRLTVESETTIWCGSQHGDAAIGKRRAIHRAHDALTALALRQRQKAGNQQKCR